MPPPRGDSPRGHLTAAQLSVIAEGGSSPDPAVARHLAECRKCLAIYLECVEMRDRILSPSGIEPAPPRWLERGLAVAGASEEPGDRQTASVHQRRRASRPAMLVAAGLAAVIGAVVFWPSSRPQADDRKLVAERMREDSHGGLLYSDNLMPLPRGIRGSAGGSRFDAVLAEQVRRYNGGARAPEDAFWLVGGFLSVNDLRNADAHLREALLASPTDPRLLNLAAVLAFKRNDLPAARSHLDAAIAVSRSPELLLNLAVVSNLQGDTAAAGRLIREIGSSFRGSSVDSLGAVMFPTGR
jgi:hypothetical protein